MQYLMSGHSLVLVPELCNGCGRCEEVCPHGVFAMADRKARIADRGNCMECGACRMNCAPGAISVDSGVGCAQAVINSMRRGQASSAACNCG